MSSAPTDTPEVCETCVRFTLPEVDESARGRMAGHGFGGCAHCAPYVYRSTHSRCTFQPSRWEQRL